MVPPRPSELDHGECFSGTQNDIAIARHRPVAWNEKQLGREKKQRMGAAISAVCGREAPEVLEPRAFSLELTSVVALMHAYRKARCPHAANAASRVTS